MRVLASCVGSHLHFIYTAFPQVVEYTTHHAVLAVKVPSHCYQERPCLQNSLEVGHRHRSLRGPASRRLARECRDTCSTLIPAKRRRRQRRGASRSGWGGGGSAPPGDRRYTTTGRRAQPPPRRWQRATALWRWAWTLRTPRWRCLRGRRRRRRRPTSAAPDRGRSGRRAERGRWRRGVVRRWRLPV